MIKKFNLISAKFCCTRNFSQIIFLITIIVIGYKFYSFTAQLETGIIPDIDRPPGVEGFLPISALISLKYFFQTGIVNDIHPSGLLIFLFILALSLLIKKSFCSYVCPIGFLSEILVKIHLQLFKRGLRVNHFIDYPLRLIKYGLLIFFIYTIFFKMSHFVIKQFLFSSYNKLADIKMLLFFSDITLTATIIILSLIVLSISIRNFWCRYLCPYGALLGLLSFWSPFKIRRQEKTCVSCGKCDRVCPSSINVSQTVNVISDECFACGKCVDVCPERGTLALALPGNKFRLKPVAVGIVAIFIFSGGSFLARQSGNWQNKISKTDYLNYMVENRLIDIHRIHDLNIFIGHLDQRRKRVFMRQMQEKR
ncbi:4Fe-4S binding protein [bacterium]|nr:4Fe-4S binding protein [bacterium]